MKSTSQSIRVGLAQIHIRVGVDVETMHFNIAQMRDAYAKAKEQSCDVVLMPELALTGYSPEDLLLRSDAQEAFMKAGNDFRDEIMDSGEGPTIIFGAPRLVNPNSDGEFPQGLESATTLDIEGPAVANATIIVNPGNQSSSEIYKMHLPNWGFFDDARWFARATRIGEPIDIAGVKSGVVICRDIWKESSVADWAAQDVRIIFVPNGSPYANARIEERIATLRHLAHMHGIAIAYVNMIQGCDEAVFDGGSFVVDQHGEVIASTKRFEEDFIVADIELSDPSSITKKSSSEAYDLSGSLTHADFEPEETYKAIVLGTREFINAVNPEGKVAIGLSGGVDSGLVAAIAVDAFGADRVHGVLLPSRFTSERSTQDALLLSKQLGITSETISIEKLHEVASQEFNLDALPGIVGENIQARLRGLALMMVSNSKGHLILATSNKSESAVGYCTLYGDSVGAYSPIKDVYKTQVYELCAWRNASNQFAVDSPIPESIISREPTAELRHNQTDEESLYPYEILDAVLTSFVEFDMSAEDIIARGYDAEKVNHIIALVKSSEFKRKQTPLGPRLTRRNFGKSRRIPISAHW